MLSMFLSYFILIHYNSLGACLLFKERKNGMDGGKKGKGCREAVAAANNNQNELCVKKIFSIQAKKNKKSK